MTRAAMESLSDQLTRVAAITEAHAHALAKAGKDADADAMFAISEAWRRALSSDDSAACDGAAGGAADGSTVRPMKPGDTIYLSGTIIRFLGDDMAHVQLDNGTVLYVPVASVLSAVRRVAAKIGRDQT